MNDSNAKQQIVDKIRNNTNILVTVSADPSVDELSAALGLTVLLNKLGKHATAVFSGQVPPAITFLDPEKTFENTVDSLRDFIIALDKEKADHLRYKVEGDVVKIFITPYRTTISSDDLKFSQGDYNVEVVLALGVESRDNLDQALAAHGRILHDAVVASVGTGEPSNLGSIDWTETNASCLSEMMVSLADALKGDKPLLDEQISTAFLTGIVAATDRFSNDRTSSRVMTMAAQLMGAGANQQLIAAKLEEAHEIGTGTQPTDGDDEQTGNSDGSTDLTEGESSKVDKAPKKSKKAKKEEPPKKKDDGALMISHEKAGDIEAVAEQTEEERQAAAAEIAAAELEKQTEAAAKTQQNSAAKEAEAKLAEQLAQVAPAAAAPEAVTKPSVADLQKDLAEASSEVDKAASLPPVVEQPPKEQPTKPQQIPDGEPSIGGTLNATTEQAAEDKRRAQADDRNRTILNHNAGDYVGNETKPTYEAPLNAAMSSQKDEPKSVDVFGDALSAGLPSDTAPTQKTEPMMPPSNTPALEFEPTPLPPQPSAPTLDQIDQQNRTPHDDARAAIDAAFAAAPFEPAGNPQQNIGAQPLGEVPHSDTTPAPTPSSTAPLPPPPPAMPAPPMPDLSTLPPVPNFNTPSPVQPPAAPLPPDNLEAMLGPAQSPQANDPSQFQIPGAK